MQIMKSTSKLNATIRNCLNLCYSSRMPLRDLSEYLKALFRSGEWTQEEVAAIRSATVRILRNIAQPE